MAKKKQPDFQPTKLRVGKCLPKNRNFTNISFKSKKIITKDQKFKTCAEDTSLTELLHLATHNNLSTKTTALKKIGQFSEKNSSSLASYFSDILKTIGKILLDSNSKVREEATCLIETCLKLLSSKQMNCFVEPLICHLDCMMTHINMSVKNDSLALLSIILKIHPNLICYSTKLLHDLLNMISSISHQKGVPLNQKKRKLDDKISSTIISVEWRDNVINLIIELLEKLFANFAEKKKTIEDEQKVYWDGKEPLFMPLYAGSGLSPSKLDFYSVGCTKSETKVAQELRSFFIDLIEVLSDIVTEETAALLKRRNSLIPVDTICHLNTVTQALCCYGDWYKLDSKNEVTDFLPLLDNILCDKLMRGFPFSRPENIDNRSGKKEAYLNLNLGICYLYSTFILGTEYNKPAKQLQIIICLCDILGLQSSYERKSLALIVKIVDGIVLNMSLCKELEESLRENVSELLSTLCGFLELYKDKDALIDVESFFIKIALDYEYRFLLNFPGMNRWFLYIFNTMKSMKMKSKADKKLLKCINQICIREYPGFISILNGTDPLEVLDCMKFEEENFQFAVMNLITHMNQLPSDFLQTIADFILCDQNISVKAAVKLIRLLCHRFFDPRITEEETFEFVKFLLNVACDVWTEKDFKKSKMKKIMIQGSKTINEEDFMKQNSESEYSNQMDLQQNSDEDITNLLLEAQDRCVYRIVPSNQCERHSEISEVCFECLLLYPVKEHIVEWIDSFFTELLNFRLALPVHSAIAFLKLPTGIYVNEYLKQNEYSLIFYIELISSCLLYASCITNEIPEEKIKIYNVNTLQNALHLNQDQFIQALESLTKKLFDHGTDDNLYLHVLRIAVFLISRNYVLPNDLYNFINILQSLENNLPENSQEKALLYELYDYLK